MSSGEPSTFLLLQRPPASSFLSSTNTSSLPLLIRLFASVRPLGPPPIIRYFIILQSPLCLLFRHYHHCYYWFSLLFCLFIGFSLLIFASISQLEYFASPL